MRRELSLTGVDSTSACRPPIRISSSATRDSVPVPKTIRDASVSCSKECMVRPRVRGPIIAHVGSPGQPLGAVNRYEPVSVDAARLVVMVTVDDVRRVALDLPRTTEHLIRDRVKFRVKQLVYVAFSQDEALMGFAFPREERAALVRSDPRTFLLPAAGDMRFHWVEARTAMLDVEEMTELVIDAWTMVVPKGVARDYLNGLDD